MKMILMIALVLVMGMAAPRSSSAQLSKNFYLKTCPNLITTVRSVVESAVSKKRRTGASLLRLHFHDCFVNGCDGSVLLDDTPSFRGEQSAGPNKNSLRGFNVIDRIKFKVEKLCPGDVSCADILTIAARDSVAILGGPHWDVKLGRRDSKTASFSDADSGVLPSPTSSLSDLIANFQNQGLSATDMVALSGAHTIGLASCRTFRSRIYDNESNIDSEFANKRQKHCPQRATGDNHRALLDLQTPTAFDNKYFQNVIQKKGLLHSDQMLFNGGSTDSLVKIYSESEEAFAKDFVNAMIKMGDIKPLTGSNGEIRRKCGKPN